MVQTCHLFRRTIHQVTIRQQPPQPLRSLQPPQLVQSLQRLPRFLQQPANHRPSTGVTSFHILPRPKTTHLLLRLHCRIQRIMSTVTSVKCRCTTLKVLLASIEALKIKGSIAEPPPPGTFYGRVMINLEMIADTRNITFNLNHQYIRMSAFT